MSPHVELDFKEDLFGFKVTRKGIYKHSTNDTKSFDALMATYFLLHPDLEHLHPEEVADELGPVCSSSHHKQHARDSEMDLKPSSRPKDERESGESLSWF